MRDKSDPMSLPANAFIKRFRLSKEAYSFLLCELSFKGHMSTALPPKLQLAVALSLIASGGFQHTIGNDYLVGMSQSAVSKTVNQVINEIEDKICPKFIKFLPNESASCMESFMQKFKLPEVIGCEDGTHFGLQKPSENEHMFFNRKGYRSLNSMIICDHEYRILSINSKYGGASHDSFVWKQSEQRRLLEELYNTNKLKNAWLLGDSGYPIEPWLITPYRNPEEGSAETHFNEIHSKGRCIIERTIGILKARWKILSNDKRSRYTPEKIAKFGNVCAALHNLCIYFNVPLYTQNISQPYTSTINPIIGSETQLTRIGQKIRDEIKLSLRR